MPIFLYAKINGLILLLKRATSGDIFVVATKPDATCILVHRREDSDALNILQCTG